VPPPTSIYSSTSAADGRVEHSGVGRFCELIPRFISNGVRQGTMNTPVKLVLLVVAAGLVIGTTSLISPVTASTDPARGGLDRADEEIHEDEPGLGSQQDDAFHEGICQGGHSTTALDTFFQGCDSSFISEPGNSDNHRQDGNDDDDDE
jgi:hypothetical protein